MNLRKVLQHYVDKFRGSSRLVNESEDYDSFLSRPYEDEGHEDKAIEAEVEKLIAELEAEWLHSPESIQKLLTTDDQHLDFMARHAKASFLDLVDPAGPHEPEALQSAAKQVVAQLYSDEAVDAYALGALDEPAD